MKIESIRVIRGPLHLAALRFKPGDAVYVFRLVVAEYIGVAVLDDFVHLGEYKADFLFRVGVRAAPNAGTRTLVSFCPRIFSRRRSRTLQRGLFALVRGVRPCA